MPSHQGARFEPASDQSLLIRFGDAITAEASDSVLKLLRLLQAEPFDAIRNLHPAYASLLVRFDPLKITHAELESQLNAYIARLSSIQLPTPRIVKIPVCYGGEFGPDLADVAALHQMSPDEVIAAHAGAEYGVAFLGFVPGFAYLSGLPRNLASPRLASPRRAVAAGSVGIAGNQTGVYPCVTPGGWRLIGRTPLQMFRADRAEMSLLAIGDRVRFTAISRERFFELASG